MFQGTFIFPEPPYYGRYLSVGAIFLNTSWSMHNVIVRLLTRLGNTSIADNSRAG